MNPADLNTLDTLNVVDTTKQTTNASLSISPKLSPTTTPTKNNTRNSTVLLTALQREIIQAYLDGTTRNELADMYSLDLHAVRNLLESKEARAYYREMNTLSVQTDKNYRLNLLGRIAEAKVEAHIERGDPLHTITRKDVVDILAEIDKQQKESEKVTLGTASDSVYITILNQVTGGKNV